MQILSDFDGVWTDQDQEARFIQEWLAAAVAPLIDSTVEQALADFDAFWSLALKEPHAHGWAPDGRITGFVDEDVLLSTGSVSQWLTGGGTHPRADLWREAIGRAAGGAINQWISDQFGPAMVAFRSERGHGLVEGAAHVVRGLLDAGHDLIFVSNSTQEKLEAMLGAAGIRAGAELRVVGAALKWWIDGDEPLVEVDGRRVHMDRPHYRAILEEVQPDLVIGDVASFDLALPAYMRARGELDENLRLVLRRNTNSSPWALGQIGAPGPLRLVDEAVDSVAELL